MAIKMTKEEYEKIYGQVPKTSAVPKSENKPGYLSRVGSQMKGQFNEAVESETASMEGRMNPFSAGANIAKNVSGMILSPLTQAPGFKQIGEGMGAIGEAWDKSALGSKVSDTLSKVPGIGTIADLAETGMNVAGIEGGIKMIEGAPKTIKNVVKTVSKPFKPAIAGTGRILKSTGESAYGVTVPPSDGMARSLQSYKETTPNLATRIKNTVTGETKGKPITEANTAARYGLMGTEQEIGVQSGRYMKQIWDKKVSPALSSSKGKLDMKKFFDTVEKKIIKDNPELTRRNDLLEGARALRSEFGKVNKVGLSKLQEYKQGWTKTLPEASWKGKPIASALKEAKQIASDIARDFIYKNTDPAIRQDYIDYGNLRSIREAGIKSGIGDPAKKSISRGAWQFVMDKAVTPVATTMGKILYKTGEGLEFVGESGAKTVGDIVGDKPIKKVVGENPKQLEPLAQEAQKYKSAEEFVKAQGTPVFRGVTKGTKEFSPSSNGAFNEYGFSVSADKKVANRYRAGGGVIEGYIEPKAKIKIEPNQFGDKEPGYMLDIEKVKQAKKEGYDGYTFTNKDNELETLIFNKDIIKTKSQLTDIWNKANKD